MRKKNSRRGKKGEKRGGGVEEEDRGEGRGGKRTNRGSNGTEWKIVANAQSKLIYLESAHPDLVRYEVGGT